MYRNVYPMRLEEITPGPIGPQPAFRNVDPEKLLVDETYQRELSNRSVKLVEKIVTGWDWKKFKPPVCAEVDGQLHVIDGQHTAIAAATHPGISTIPVMVVDAAQIKDRADAFIGQNRDRINITGMQLHYAALVAGDEDAHDIQKVCDRANVRLLRYPPFNGVFEPGDTVALASIRNLIKKYGVIRAREVLEILRAAELRPIGADMVKAAGEIWCAEEFKGTFTAPDLTKLIAGLGPRAEAEARALAMAKKMSKWRALVVVIYTSKGKRRG